MNILCSSNILNIKHFCKLQHYCIQNRFGSWSQSQNRLLLKHGQTSERKLCTTSFVCSLVFLQQKSEIWKYTTLYHKLLLTQIWPPTVQQRLTISCQTRTRGEHHGLQISEEVREAVHTGKAVVALESTIITHGMPRPQNLETALAVEQIIRDNGAIPATVAVLEGIVFVGLSNEEISRLAEKSSQLVKISRRDLPVVIAEKLSGGTTVSATMIAAHQAGIPIFATGGIGGVHLGVEESQDVSADLTELGRTPVAVVSAGVKSILDIARTLEYLETEGVCVVTYGPTKDFPAFFAPRSGHYAPYYVKTVAAAADVIEANMRASLNSGILFAVPIPEEFAASGEAIEVAILAAVEEARIKKIKGKEVTPFILQRVSEITGGASLEANMALVKNNAKVAAQIAVALSKKRTMAENIAKAAVKSNIGAKKCFDLSLNGADVPLSPAMVKAGQSASDKTVVIGGIVVDFCAKVKEDAIKMHGGTYQGKIYQSFGGVGRNIADCMSRLGSCPLFISVLGDDAHASAVFANHPHMNLTGVYQMKGHSTPTYCPVFTSSGHLMFGIGDMDLHSVVSPQMISNYKNELAAASIVCLDGNFLPEVIEEVCRLCFEAKVPVWFDATDIHKATKPFQTNAWRQLSYISPNLNEAARMWSSLTGCPELNYYEDSLSEVVKVASIYCRDLLKHIPVVMVTLGRHGLLIGHNEQDCESPAVLRYYPADIPGHRPVSIVNVSGAGDCLNAGMMHFLIEGHDLDLCVKAGLLASQHSLQCHTTVPASITPDKFTPQSVEAAWGSYTPEIIRD